MKTEMGTGMNMAPDRTITACGFRRIPKSAPGAEARRRTKYAKALERSFSFGSFFLPVCPSVRQSIRVFQGKGVEFYTFGY